MQPEVQSLLPYDEASYNACAAQFEKNYAPWMQMQKKVELAIAKSRTLNVHQRSPALLAALIALHDEIHPRLNGTRPPGAVYYAKGTFALIDEMLTVNEQHHASCLNQVSIGREVSTERMEVLPFTGKRAQDLIIACGAPDGATRVARETQLRELLVAFENKSKRAHADASAGGRNVRGAHGYVGSFGSAAKGDTLRLLEANPNAKCVPNGRVKVFNDGTVGKDCDLVYSKETRGAEIGTLHLAHQSLPFQVKPGDQIGLVYELDGDAPANTENKLPHKPGAAYVVMSVTRGDKSVYGFCDTGKYRNVSIRNVWASPDYDKISADQ